MENGEIITIQNTRANKILSNMKKNKQKEKKLPLNYNIQT